MSRFSRDDLVRVIDPSHPLFDTTFTVTTVTRSAYRYWEYPTTGHQIPEHHLTLADKDHTE